MRYANVCLESFGYVLPDESISSAEIEDRLAPLYRRLRLPEGRLALITGIRRRRLWPAGSRPSQFSLQSARRALERAGVAAADLGAVVHASVCRDYLEPATACFVHQGLSLGERCQIFDLSNACLGFLNGMLLVANMIELGQIKAGLVVCTEDARPVLETTIAHLNAEQSLSRQSIKSALATLTLGSASVAGVLVDRRRSRTGNRLHAATVRAFTTHSHLCRGGPGQGAWGGPLLMHTDSEALLEAGIACAQRAFSDFLAESGWTRDQLDYTFCHQVGPVHRRRLVERLGLDPARDASTVEELGNTGSAALPLTAALALERDRVAPGSRLAMLGIGSGINVLLAAVEWQRQPAATPPGLTRAAALAGSAGGRNS